jgi:hypothetical protein
MEDVPVVVALDAAIVLKELDMLPAADEVVSTVIVVE